MFGVNRKIPLNQVMQIFNNVNDPETLYKQMYENNPEFKKFVEETKGMSIEDIAKKYNISI